jgi:predicted transcriptional regulator
MKKGHFTKARIAAVVAMHDAGHSARAIGRELQCSPNTALAYISRAAEYLADPLVKKLVEKWRETEADELVVLRAKARARLHEKLDDNKMKPIELIALQDRAFNQSRVLEGKSNYNVFHGVMLKLQQDALEKNLKKMAEGYEVDHATGEWVKTAGKKRADRAGKAEAENEEQDTGRPRTRRKRAANATTSIGAE